MTPFGDHAVRFTIPEGAPRRRLFATLAALPNVRDVVLAEEVGCIVFDDATRKDLAPIAAALASAQRAGEDEPGAHHAIRVVYDGEDLDDVARAIGRSREDVIALHSGAEYRVSMLGFLPGFAYLRGLPPELRLPRRAPRPRVPARSVAIAADYTGIYPFASPGGWHLLGRAPSFVPFDPAGAGHAALTLGDTVRFAPSTESELEAATRPIALEEPREIDRPYLEVTRAAGMAVFVDGGRPGRMHEGIPPGGPLVRSHLARVNALLGNAPGACGVEVVGTLEVTARGGAVEVADDVGGALTLSEGDRLVVATAGRARVRYLAIAGGIEAPVILGGRGTLLAAGIGGLLRRGERLVPGTDAPRLPRTEIEPAPTEGPIAITAGPDASQLDLERLASTELRVSSASDRTGTRLEGSLPLTTQATARSTPMVVGAIELTPSGLIVLGPDHPTTGGYPVVGIVRTASLDRLFARPIGGSVRLMLD
ncbi:MAG: Allophanate hydrolase 2 subunit 1, partial [Labilithrix sp.]|nr:Allophanate hydrolase 2 subunit 1 [Labilithrix sp.]